LSGFFIYAAGIADTRMGDTKMKAMYLLVFVLSFAVAMFWCAGSGRAEIYFFEDFEGYSDGDDVANESDIWEVLDAAQASGIASTVVAHTGQMSCVLQGNSCIGINLDLSVDMPESFVASVWYYHDADQDPPPDSNFVFGDVVPIWNDAILVGTRSVAPDPDNYTYRDKKGDAVVADTKVQRKSDWVNLTFVIEENRTDLYIDGEEIHNSDFGSLTYRVLCCERVWDVTTGDVFYDNFVLADTIEDALSVIAVESAGKSTTMWGKIKAQGSTY
jgi:hypothetical protein